MKHTVQRNGFTLPELMFSMALFVIMTASIYPVVFGSMLQVKAGTSQTVFNARTRLVQQKLVRLVQHSKYFEVLDDNTLHLFDPENQRTVIRYEDEDGNQETIEDNRLVMVTPDGNESVLATTITRLTPDQPIISLEAGTPRVVRFVFHVGDWLQGQASYQHYRTGPGYQGVVSRFSATPRNLQRWYD